MSSISGYDNDVFISYSHFDNHPIRDEYKGWVEILHERLEIRLAQLLGERPRIWRDSRLYGGDRSAETNAVNLSKSAVLICVLTPAYTCELSPERFLIEELDPADRG